MATELAPIEIQRAAAQIRDYYCPTPYEALKGEKWEPLERARAAYIKAMQRNIEAASAVNLRDLFPKLKED
jgi:hypothetical protein